MPTRLKKSRTLRGHVSCGHGRVGKHRKHAGGRGNAGGFTHMRINFQKYHPDHFGKCGMRQFHRNPNHFFKPTIDVEKVWALLSDEYRQEVTKKSGVMPVIDVTEYGYFKVLGSGKMWPHPACVRAREFSERARKKIEECGGKCVLTGQERAVAQK